MQIRAEVDHCRPRILKYCRGQGLDLGCGNVKIKPDAIGIDLMETEAMDMKLDARMLSQYPDGHFDFVFSSHLLEELANTEATLKEWLRIIKDGGYLVLYQVDSEYYYPLGHPNCNPHHKHHFSWESLWEKFKEIGAGVELVHHQRYAPEPYQEWSFELVVRKHENGEPVKKDEADKEAIALLIPTLHRPDSMKKFAQAVEATTAKKDLVEIVFGVHADDEASLKAIEELKECSIPARGEVIEKFQDGRVHLSFLWNQLYKATSAPIVGFFGDDVIFHTPGWDQEVRDEFHKEKNIMVSCNDVHIHRGRTSTLFFTHRTVHDKVGYYLNENFRRWYVDTFWDEAFKQVGKLHYREDLITEHLSPDVFKERTDDTYRNMEDHKGQDRVNWTSAPNHQEIARVASIIKEMG